MFVSGLILAAGRGARMGRTKPLLPLRGRPLLSHVIAAALASRLDEVVVVLGYEAGAVREGLGAVEGVRFVDNPEFGRGQSSSVSVGLDALDPRSGAAAVLLGDQPTVTAGAIDRVVGEFLASGAVAARAVYATSTGTVAGHPTVLGRRLWDEVRAVVGDLGARDVLSRHGRDVVLVPCDEPAPVDVDTFADYQSLRDSGE